MAFRSIDCECGNDFWDRQYVDTDDGFQWMLVCTNCMHQRPYRERTNRTDTVTKSQKRALKKLEHYAEDYERGTRIPVNIETNLTEDTGALMFNAKFRPGDFQELRVIGWITRRGKMTISSAYRPNLIHTCTEHMAAMLDAHLPSEI